MAGKVSLHQSRRGECGVGRNWPGGVALGFRGASTRVYSLYIFLAVCHHPGRICASHLKLHHVTLSPAAISRGVLVCVQVRSRLSATRTSHSSTRLTVLLLHGRTGGTHLPATCRSPVLVAGEEG